MKTAGKNKEDVNPCKKYWSAHAFWEKESATTD